MKRRACFFGVALLSLASLATAKDLGFSWSRWSVVTQGVLLDSQTSLQWTQEDNGNVIDWNGAQQYCRGTTWAGGGWRLPTMDELSAIYDLNAHPFSCLTLNGQAYSCKTSSLFHLTTGVFWSGTTAPSDSSGTPMAWVVHLIDGVKRQYDTSIEGPRALCVRQR